MRSGEKLIADPGHGQCQLESLGVFFVGENWQAEMAANGLVLHMKDSSVLSKMAVDCIQFEMI